jgi:hypothetical protein
MPCLLRSQPNVKGERLDVGVEQLDLERAVARRRLLADQLVKSLAGDNARATPSSNGSPLFTNGWSERANTNGSTGRMHGLTMVKAPPRYARGKRIIACARFP